MPARFEPLMTQIRTSGVSLTLFGTMRECLAQGVAPTLLAKGARAGVAYLMKTEEGFGDAPRGALTALWAGQEDDGLMEECLKLIAD